jgi:hypothetical protein
MRTPFFCPRSPLNSGRFPTWSTTVSERQGPTPSPSISASPDDLARRPRSGRVADKRGVVGVSMILTILIAGLAVAGWFVANQQQQLARSEREMAAAVGRIGLL